MSKEHKIGKPTPGPWELDERACYIFHDGDPIGQVRGWGYLTGAASLNLPDEEAEAIQRANGLLMAAAPDLLAACELALEARCLPTDTGLWMDKRDKVAVALRDAIAKAKGEQP